MTRFFVVVSLVAMGCGGGAASGDGADRPEPPPEPLTAEAHLPADTFLVAKLDLTRLRESANWDLIESWLLTTEENVARELPELGNGELRRWTGETDRVWLGLSPSQDPRRPDMFGVVEGRFEAEPLAALLTSLGGDDPMFTPRAGAAIPTFQGEEDLGEVGILEDGLAATGTSGRLSEIVARHAANEGQSPLANPALAPLAQRVNFRRDAIGVAVVFTPEAKAALTHRVDARVQRVLDVATAGVLRLGLAEGIDAVAIVSTTDPNIAAGAVSEIQRQRDIIKQQPFVLMMGLGPIFDGIGVNAEEGDLRVSLRASHEDTRNLMGRVSGFVALALGNLIGDGGGAPDAPPPEPTL